MCTLVILHRPGHDWPLIVAGNRDEMRDRAWRPPGRHWLERPGVIAGLDEFAGGTWFGINDAGLVAAVMNREGSLGPAAGKRSRGELVLEALDHTTAGEAAAALASVDPAAYRGFNLFVGDPASAWWLRHGDDGNAPRALAVDAGLHMLTARDMDDPGAPRIAHWLPRFHAAPVPDPDRNDFAAWQDLLADRSYPAGQSPGAAMNQDIEGRFGTICSQIVALPRDFGGNKEAMFLFAPRPPDRVPFERIGQVGATRVGWGRF